MFDDQIAFVPDEILGEAGVSARPTRPTHPTVREKAAGRRKIRKEAREGAQEDPRALAKAEKSTETGASVAKNRASLPIYPYMRI